MVWWRRKKAPERKVLAQGVGGIESLVRTGVSLGSSEGHINLPEHMPFGVYQLYAYLREAIPDVSAGIWSWTKVCQAPWWVEYIGGTKADRTRAAGLIADLDRRIYEYRHTKFGGIDSLLGHFFLSVFTYGAFAGELVLDRRRTNIERFILVDVSTVRFRRGKDGRSLEPFQEIDGRQIDLNPYTFFYFGLDPDGDNPYGRSPLRSLPFVLRIQQQLQQDMSRAMHNTGFPRLHIRYQPPARDPGERPQDYVERLETNFGKLRDGFDSIKPDENFLTYDNVEISLVGTGRSLQWYESQKAIEEQVISGLHLAPFMIGRNYGTTQTWGAAQYELILRNARSVQVAAAHFCEWLRNFELALRGEQVRTRHHFKANKSIDILMEAQADSIRVNSVVLKRDEGFIDQAQAAAELGYGAPAKDEGGKKKDENKTTKTNYGKEVN